MQCKQQLLLYQLLHLYQLLYQLSFINDLIADEGQADTEHEGVVVMTCPENLILLRKILFLLRKSVLF